MTAHRSLWLALLAGLVLSGAAACGSNEPSGTTPACKEPDASDCFTLPDGGAVQPDVATQADSEPPDAEPDADDDADTAD